MADQPIAVLITASSDDEAAAIARTLVEARKAACVNIVPGVRSLYWWQGKMETSREVLLVAKTISSLLDQVIELVKRNHSYTVPEVIALPITGGNEDYLDWMRSETAQPAE